MLTPGALSLTLPAPPSHFVQVTYRDGAEWGSEGGSSSSSSEGGSEDDEDFEAEVQGARRQGPGRGHHSLITFPACLGGVISAGRVAGGQRG